VNHINEATPDSFSMLMTPEELAKENNPLGLPEGFFKVISATKKELGFGFYCPKCKLHAPLVGKKGEVKHCGRVDVLPKGLLAGRKLGTYKLPLTPLALATALRS